MAEGESQSRPFGAQREDRLSTFNVRCLVYFDGYFSMSGVVRLSLYRIFALNRLVLMYCVGTVVIR